MSERLTPQREAEIAAAVAEMDADRALSFGTWTASPVTEKTTLPPEQAFAVEDVARLGNATIRGSVGVFGDERHAAFTALARDAVPALLAELAAVRAERNELERELAQARADKQQYFTALQGVARRAGLDIAPAQNQCAAEHGGPGYTRCELPAGHDGYHDSAMGNLRRATWGRPAADEAVS